MKLILFYWGCMIAAYIFAAKMREKTGRFKWLDPVMNASIYLCVLLMGLRMGANQEVVESLGTIGVQALIITVLAVSFSIGAVTVTRKLLHMDRYGNSLKRSADSVTPSASEKKEPEHRTAGSAPASSPKEEAGGASNLKTTLLTVAMVALGMLAGYFLILRKLGIADRFMVLSDQWLTILIAILLTFAGMGLGFSGSVFSNLRTVGFKVLFFPVAAVSGTFIAGLLYGLFSPLTIGESIAVVSGFGWYTYAPNVISQAGHVVASAISFLHNVLRETIGIIGIPLIASKIGYLETAAVPGVAAMDICVPIVERSCREDTVVYSFATGFLMCILVPVVTSLAV